MSVPLPTSIFGKSIIASPTVSKGERVNGKQIAIWSVVAVITGVAIALIIYFLVKMSKGGNDHPHRRHHRRHHRHHHKINPIPIHVHPNPIPHHGKHIKPIPIHVNPTPTHLATKPMPPQTFAGTLAPQVLNRYEIFSRPCRYSEKDLEPVEQSRYEYDNVEPLVGFDARDDNQVTAAYPYMRPGTGQNDKDELLVFSRQGCPYCVAAEKAGVYEKLSKALGIPMRKAYDGESKKYDISGVPAVVHAKSGKKAVGFNKGTTDINTEVQRMMKDLGLETRAGGFTAALAQVSASGGGLQPTHTGVVIMVADGCGYCDKLKKEVLPNLASNSFTVLNARDVPSWLGSGVKGFPHTKCLKDGQVVGEISGYLPLTKFVGKLKAIYNQ